MPPNDRHNMWTHAGPNNRHQQHTSCPLASALSPWAGFRPMDYSCSRHQRQRVPAGWIPPNDRHNTWTHADPNNRHQQHTSFPLCLVRFRKGPGRFQVGYQRAGFRPTIDTIRGPMQTPTTGTNSTRHFHCVWYGFGRGPAVSRWITEAKTEAVQSPAHPQKNQTHLGMLVASLVPVFSTLIFQTNRP